MRAGAVRNLSAFARWTMCSSGGLPGFLKPILIKAFFNETIETGNVAPHMNLGRCINFEYNNSPGNIQIESWNSNSHIKIKVDNSNMSLINAFDLLDNDHFIYIGDTRTNNEIYLINEFRFLVFDVRSPLKSCRGSLCFGAFP